MSYNKDDKKRELIPVIDGEIGGVRQHVVDCRTLHAVLGVNRDFTTWIKKRISDYKFQESIDYLLTKSGEQLPSGTKYSTEYSVSLDMAKELAMVERTEMGRAVRKYFIECEKRLLNSRDDSGCDGLSDEERAQDEKEILMIGEAARQRVLFWALEKRDRIYHAGMNRQALFSITCDIEKSLWRELLYYYKAFLYADKNYDISFHDMLNFFKTWEPEFFKEERLKNQSSENGYV